MTSKSQKKPSDAGLSNGSEYSTGRRGRGRVDIPETLLVAMLMGIYSPNRVAYTMNLDVTTVREKLRKYKRLKMREAQSAVRNSAHTGQ